MRLMLSLRNTTACTGKKNPLPKVVSPLAAIILGLLLTSLSLTGCTIKPTYKASELPEVISKLCEKDLSLSAEVEILEKTLWVYVPLEHFIIIEKGKAQFDPGALAKVRGVLKVIESVILSSDTRLEFYVLHVSDIKEYGTDYRLTGYILDTKYNYARYITKMELNKRIIVDYQPNLQALKDRKGEHIKRYGIAMGEFLARQIAQRAWRRLEEEPLRNRYQTENITGSFTDKEFLFTYQVGSLRPTPAAKEAGSPEVAEEILKITRQVLREYKFMDFLLVEINDQACDRRRVVTKSLLLGEFK